MKSHTVVRITASETQVVGSENARKRVREEFDRVHCIALTQFLAPDLLAEVQAEVDDAHFDFRSIPGLKAEECMETNRIYARLHLLMNDDTLLRAVDELTGVSASYFLGRVYRKVPGRGHRAEWHDDCKNQRLLGVTVNLGRRPYEGGALQMRRLGSTHVFCEARPAQPADALLFRIDPAFQHRADDVTGDTPRTVLTGWFHAGGTFKSLLSAGNGETTVGGAGDLVADPTAGP